MHMNNADLSQAPPEMVNELVKNDPTAAPLFLELQKTSKELGDAQKSTDNQAFLDALLRPQGRGRKGDRGVQVPESPRHPAAAIARR